MSAMEHISNGLDWEYSRRGYGKHFGIAISKKWLNTSASKLVIRGHEPCQGFKNQSPRNDIDFVLLQRSISGVPAEYIKIARKQLENLHDGGGFVRYIKKIP